MQRLYRLIRVSLVLALLVAGSGPFTISASARQNDVVITFALPGIMAELYGTALVEQFEAQNPGIRVKLIKNDTGLMMSASASDVNAYLDDFAEYASLADVLYVRSDMLSPYATIAGYLLDLAPLTSADASLNEADFYPAAWQSLQWDGGVWAVPFGIDPVVLIYDADAFDAAGLAYPTANWTIDDFANAIRTLTQFNAEGTIERPALQIFSNALSTVFLSDSGTNLFDPTSIPYAPHFSDDNLAHILTTWAELQAEGYLDRGPGSEVVMIGGENAYPLQITSASFGLSTFSLGGDSDTAQRLIPTTFPGGGIGLSVEGVAISGGTRYPDAAYAFASFLSSSPLTANSFMSSHPARQSLVGMDAPAPVSGDSGPVLSLGGTLSPENEALIVDLLQHAIPVSDTRYGDYLLIALSRVQQDQIDALVALQEAEVMAFNDLETAQQRQGTPLVVAEPQPDVVLGTGEIALNFGIFLPIQPFPNQADWDRVIAEFVAQNPAVGQINLQNSFELSLEALAEDNDCFYLPYNAVSAAGLDSVLALDPLIDADPAFDRNDVLPGVLAQVQQNDRIWAYPLNIQPQILKYDPDLLAQAGVPAPENGWTAEEFMAALRALAPLNPDQAPFQSMDFGGGYLSLLVAAFGGLPFDYRTDPPTANFTDPATVDAIRQVLDLAKDGYMNYQELALQGGGNAIFVSVGLDSQVPVYSASLNTMNQAFAPEFNGGDRVVTYPTGRTYTPVAYDLGTGYISAKAQNPQACYDWLSTLAQHPELLGGMPARRSLIDAAATFTEPDLVALYRQFDAQLQRPDAVIFPSTFSAGEDPSRFMLQNWLNRAFDNYVLHDADLAVELAEAQQYVEAFQVCISEIPADALVSGANNTTFEQYAACAVRVDPSLSAVFGG